MKKNEKICIMILTGIYIFFIAIFNVKAQSVEPAQLEFYNSDGALLTFGSSSMTPRFTIPFYYRNGQYDGNTFVNGLYGSANGISGNYFTFYMYIYEGNFRSLNASIQLTNGDYISCKVDNSMSNNRIYSATCDLSNLGGNNAIYKYGFNWQIEPNYTTLTNNYSQFQISKLFYFNNITSYENQIAQNTQDIENSLNEDVDNNYKDTPNQSDYNNYHQKENDIIGQISNTDTSAINIQNNNNANLFIWDTLTRSLQSHAKVMALMISILSIGIIKLILNR